MNPEQKNDSRTLKTIAILSACAAFMLIGGSLFIKYKAWTGKDRIATIHAGEEAARKAIEMETDATKLRNHALRYQKVYAESSDQTLTTVNEISNISLAISMFPLLILVRVINSLKGSGAAPRP
jgi:hypothetical protein